MRALALFAAITLMHTVHALPRPDLTVRQDGSDLRDESHIFHHLDRNPRTANRVHERTHGDDAAGSGQAVVKRVSERPQRTRVVERRFMQNPDYSQGGGSNDGYDAHAATTSESGGRVSSDG